MRLAINVVVSLRDKRRVSGRFEDLVHQRREWMHAGEEQRDSSIPRTRSYSFSRRLHACQLVSLLTVTRDMSLLKPQPKLTQERVELTEVLLDENLAHQQSSKRTRYLIRRSLSKTLSRHQNSSNSTSSSIGCQTY